MHEPATQSINYPRDGRKRAKMLPDPDFCGTFLAAAAAPGSGACCCPPAAPPL
eukprot:CAMPEP_0202920704 /NCGR_PEP_ID=MMETSP1392-20130828/76994_1 /ASSEMBLY_ACC=CAM_ASM_000868 /TAXON_ID=225041 /ORGANISM="Chlamydomonas chlamydogama, Strain SAG 11-48b" /LENGTH=52 /DNA_ID=CAMNT_0049614213 /DNA_START=1008 /DNA_END=1163 /DNA_ORIENTATION=-